MPTILLSEDDEFISETITQILERDGYVVLIARDGQEGLDLALKKGPDLIITDYHMPKMDGLTMCARLKEAGFQAPAILITAHADAQNLPTNGTCIEAVLEKPFLMPGLFVLVRKLLSKFPQSTHQE